MKTNNERREFFKKAGVSAIGAGLFSILPLKLFSTPNSDAKNSHNEISIKINPMAVKREKRK